MALDFTHSRLPPFQHQREDVQSLIDYPFFFITSEMRTGKTKIVIDAIQFLYPKINKVIVVTPAPVRDVWYDPEFGELQKHLWLNIPATVIEYHTYLNTWRNACEGPRNDRLQWIITNYEFIRSKNRLIQLLPFCGQRTALILDESSFVRNYDTEQTRSCVRLRRACSRVVLLNGTPIFHSPLDLFSQGNILHPKILDCPYITHYRSRYAVTKAVLGLDGKPITDPRGHKIETIEGWLPEGLTDLQRRFAPYTVRRLQADCLDLPPKLDPVTLTATLTKETWKDYKSMRDDLVIWLKSDVATAASAAIKVMRLAQITSGFVGGVEKARIATTIPDSLFESLDIPPATGPSPEEPVETKTEDGIHFIGREKLDVVIWFLTQQLIANPLLKVVIWCKHRPEMFRMVKELKALFPRVIVSSIYGKQKERDRIDALRLLHPDTTPKSPIFMVGTFGTGSFGLNFSAASVCINCSADYSLGKHLQANDRIYGPGMLAPAAYFDVLAVGPSGQRTIDHVIEAARRNAENIASYTINQWVKKLTEGG